jgi:uncharacterized protein
MTTAEALLTRETVRAPAREYVPAAPVAPVDPASQIADPGPLGLAGFAATTFVLSLFNAGMVGNPKLEAVVLPFALLYGGLAQVLAGMWEFKKNNTFGAVAFTSYGMFWISLFFYIKYVAAGLPAADAHTATGIFLLTWTIFTAYMTVASIATNRVLTVVFATLLAAFVFLTLGAFNGNVSLTHAGGYVGLGVALLAWYASAAGVTNATFGKTVLPVFPAKKA